MHSLWFKIWILCIYFYEVQHVYRCIAIGLQLFLILFTVLIIDHLKTNSIFPAVVISPQTKNRILRCVTKREFCVLLRPEGPFTQEAQVKNGSASRSTHILTHTTGSLQISFCLTARFRLSVENRVSRGTLRIRCKLGTESRSAVHPRRQVAAEPPTKPPWEYQY